MVIDSGLATFHGGEQSNAVAQPCFFDRSLVAANGFAGSFIRFGGVLCHVCIVTDDRIKVKGRAENNLIFSAPSGLVVILETLGIDADAIHSHHTEAPERTCHVVEVHDGFKSV